MRKLEIKDIIGYLPYGLKIQAKGEVENGKPIIFETNGFAIENNEFWIECLDEGNIYGKSIDIEDARPLLRPMTDLIKPITVKGYNGAQEFIPIREISRIMNLDGYNGLYTLIEVKNKTLEFSIWEGLIATYDYQLNLLNFKPGNSCHLSFKMSRQIIDLLNQWHFDYRGLIDEGLAIDINTLDK